MLYQNRLAVHFPCAAILPPDTEFVFVKQTTLASLADLQPRDVGRLPEEVKNVRTYLSVYPISL